MGGFCLDISMIVLGRKIFRPYSLCLIAYVIGVIGVIAIGRRDRDKPCPYKSNQGFSNDIHGLAEGAKYLSLPNIRDKSGRKIFRPYSI